LNKSNRRIRLKSRPDGMPDEGTWELNRAAIRSPDANEILVKVSYVSIDPAMRGWISDQESYLPPVAIGETMRALAIGQVLESQHEAYQTGDFVSGMFGVQEYATLQPDASVAVIDPQLAALTTQLGVLGMPGMTAYFGLLDVGQPKQGETLLVSGAAGAVGALVGQIGRLQGCRVVGVAGGREKCEFLTDVLGFDDAIDYKAEKDLGAALGRACPEGIDIFFDNVGGDLLEATLFHLSHRARVVICGAISQYNCADSVSAQINYIPILYRSARLEGFVVLDYMPRYGEAVEALSGWLSEDLICPHEDVREGIEKFPQTLNALFSGKNFGKLILKLNTAE